MGFLDDLITNVPWEKFILQPPDKTKALEELARVLRKSTASVPSNEPQEIPEPLSTSAEQATGVSDQQTLFYQLDKLLSELRQLEIHLSEGCSIDGE
jgi:hypothetical protein